ncbi:MAG TPA: hypothetical protein VGO07_06265 [Candidatus Saccharimonadales bacterium]|jgi:hypothetical protein|nr:hypothetical protein [Candidatus Saccharimonadales bacterium]
MFGSKKQVVVGDTLPVTVHSVRSAETFAAAQKLWSVNARAVIADPQSGKEVIHFALTNPRTVMWFQRDTGRTDEFELIISWQQDKTVLTDIHIILPGPEKAGDDTYVRQVLEGLLTSAATVPFAQSEAK